MSEAITGFCENDCFFYGSSLCPKWKITCVWYGKKHYQSVFKDFDGLYLPFTAFPEAGIEEAVAGTAAKSIPEIFSCSHPLPEAGSHSFIPWFESQWILIRWSMHGSSVVVNLCNLLSWKLFSFVDVSLKALKSILLVIFCHRKKPAKVCTLKLQILF